MNKLKVGTRIYVLVGMGLLLGAVAASFLLVRLTTVSDTYEELFVDEVQLQDSARVMQVHFKEEVQEWKNLLLRGSDFEAFKKYHKAFQEAQGTVNDAAKQLRAQVTEAELQALIDQFSKAHETLGGKYQEAFLVFERSQGKDTAAADAIVKGQDRAPTDLCDTIVSNLQKEVAQSRADLRASLTAQQWVITLVMLGCFVVVGLASLFSTRSLTKQLVGMTTELAQSSEQVVAAAGQVATSAQSLSQGSTEQAASLEETSASMEEMASMTRKNAENASQAATFVTDVARQVTDSNAALTAMVGSMNAIKESSNKVAKIIKTIDEIAFQTNILALNAAVEAARAGEAGMGFAVVADEVRNLAQRSAQAAKDTAGLIEESIARSQEGGVNVDEVATAIGSITESVTRVKSIVEEVRQASQQQTQGIEQVTQAISQMEKVTQSTAATAEESAAASEELNAQAETSMAVVRELETLVGGGGRSAAPVARPKPAAAKEPSRVVPMAARKAAKAQTAEEAIPLGDTGTFGKF